MLMRIAAERKRREIDPTIALLAELSQRLAKDKNAPAQLRERVTRMHEFISTLATWYEQVRVLPKSTLVTLMKLGGKVARFVAPLSKTKTGDCPYAPRFPPPAIARHNISEFTEISD